MGRTSRTGGVAWLDAWSNAGKLGRATHMVSALGLLAGRSTTGSMVRSSTTTAGCPAGDWGGLANTCAHGKHGWVSGW
jgi:hypothetical protein